MKLIKALWILVCLSLCATSEALRKGQKKAPGKGKFVSGKGKGKGKWGTKCGSTTTLSLGQMVFIKSKNYPLPSRKAQDCTWNFEGATDNLAIKIFCLDFDLNGCRRSR
ncbi:uncharacterized protein [Palaemon carinicauda]|uniref:uncharacterized protein n=1 Tax=Palaemon carinicauda TaxID=392227 RepID=UPI0035B67B65